jgi:hypothetical protein
MAIRKLFVVVLSSFLFLIPARILAQYNYTHPEHYRRYYDRDYRDYHEWNEREARAWHRYWEQQHRREIAWERAKERERRAYWRWRHEHSGY